MKLYTPLISTVQSPPFNLHRRFSISLCSTHRLNLTESLQNQTLQTLEWPSICNQLAAFTSTPMGLIAARNANIPIGRSSDESRKLLDQTTAAMAILSPLDFSGIEDVMEIVNVSVSGDLLSIREICTVRRTLKAARELFQQLKEISSNSERYTPLLEILQKCNFLLELERKIGFCLDCKFSVILDRASEELEIIRSERKGNMENLESLLKQVSSRIFQAGGIDRPLVTTRRSRMCVGVRASHRYLLPGGVVLNVSSSGATYFMEPKEAVELNNMEVRLLNHEKAEERAIFSMLTSQIAESKTEIKYLLDRILEVDFAVARASHARWLGAVRPNLISKLSTCIASGGDDHLSVNIEGIQHPLLLEASLRASSDFVESNSSQFWNRTLKSEVFAGSLDFPVPIDIKIKCGTRVVVISGPNTGGKTASLKTLGLASIMLKAGMYLPAKNRPSLPWFDLILADIGDHQSLEQNLSTFSGHLSWLCKILEVASEESLILIDEIGSGTDPSEGVALSTSILQYLKYRVNLALVTTHYADLSLMKETDSRFENAAMEFSLETLQPTYRVIWGNTGESNALRIAESIGFDAEIISCAHAWVQRLMPDKMQKRKGLLYQSLMEERSRLETQAGRAASLHTDVMHLYNEIREEAEDLAQREVIMKATEAQQIRREIKSAVTQIEEIVNEFDNQLRNASTDQFNTLLKQSESAIASVVEVHRSNKGFPTTGTPASSSYIPQIGEKVHVKGLGYKFATVVEVEADEDGTVLVQCGKMKVRVDISSISPPTPTVKDTTNSAPHMRKASQRNKSLRNFLKDNSTEAVPYGSVIQTSKNTVDLRGMRVDEASRQLKLAIGATGSNSVLFIIHGMGTGVIKECTLEVLGKHPRVEKFEQESPMNYGCTVAHIK
ncbi:hypothetical protein AgCh_021539 [Apium graveolens]